MTNLDFNRFQPTLLQFLEELQHHNNRDWFQKNKGRYEQDVLQPSLAFIRAFQPRLKKISPMFVASDRRIGGSLMRIYRDTRFGKDKTPYKTNVGIQFRHEMGKDVHAPGFYIHIAPDECFLGAGLWRPDPPSLARLRKAIVDDAARWKRARDNKRFRENFELAGDSLKTAPRGIAKDHPLIEDLRRKDFIGQKQLRERDILSNRFLDEAAASFAASRPYMRYLCESLAIPF